MSNRTETLHLDADTANSPFSMIGFGDRGPLGYWRLEGTMTLGRFGSDADVAVPSGVVSTRHGELAATGTCVLYQDTGSSNGTYHAGARTEGPIQLLEGDSLEFAPASHPSEVAFRLVVVRGASEEPTWQRVDFGPDVREVVFGRGAIGVDLDDAYMSERHASVFRSSKGPYVLDLNSTNGVWLNGTRVRESAPVAVGNVIRLGTTIICVGTDELWVGTTKTEAGSDDNTSVDPSPVPNEHPAAAMTRPKPDDGSHPAPRAPRPAPSHGFTDGGLAIDIVEKSVWNRFKRKTILRNVQLSVSPGDLVLILGGSGAGKTTFLNAVMGYDKAEGTVRLGDLDVYEEYESIKTQIGYVPQQDLLRMNDTVHETLLAAAKLRMPARSTQAEFEERVEWASDLLGLSREGETLVGRLSGGQRKRLSIAVELVGDPKLFFLDEPDSGLDGVMARALLQNLRSIADLGKMVLVITHGPDRAAELFSKVLVLAKSEHDGAGHLVFWGTPAEAKEFFGVSTLEGVVRRINRPDEGGEGRADEYIDKWEDR